MLRLGRPSHSRRPSPSSTPCLPESVAPRLLSLVFLHVLPTQRTPRQGCYLSLSPVPYLRRGCSLAHLRRRSQQRAPSPRGMPPHPIFRGPFHIAAKRPRVRRLGLPFRGLWRARLRGFPGSAISLFPLSRAPFYCRFRAALKAPSRVKASGNHPIQEVIMPKSVYQVVFPIRPSRSTSP